MGVNAQRVTLRSTVCLLCGAVWLAIVQGIFKFFELDPFGNYRPTKQKVFVLKHHRFGEHGLAL